jgi:hypothetical protein
MQYTKRLVVGNTAHRARIVGNPMARNAADIYARIVDEFRCLSKYPELDRTEIVEHQRSGGWREGASLSPYFDVRWYLDENPDVEEDGIEPLEHFLRSGGDDLRDPHPGLMKIHSNRVQHRINLGG